MANPQNLKPRKLTKEQASEMGKLSAESRRIRKEGRELVRDLVLRSAENMPIAQGMIAQLKELGICEHDCNIEMLMHFGQMVKAVSEGDTKAYMAIMKMLGYDIEQVKVTSEEPIVIKFGE